MAIIIYDSSLFFSSLLFSSPQQDLHCTLVCKTKLNVTYLCYLQFLYLHLLQLCDHCNLLGSLTWVTVGVLCHVILLVNRYIIKLFSITFSDLLTFIQSIIHSFIHFFFLFRLLHFSLLNFHSLNCFFFLSFHHATLHHHNWINITE